MITSKCSSSSNSINIQSFQYIWNYIDVIARVPLWTLTIAVISISTEHIYIYIVSIWRCCSSRLLLERISFIINKVEKQTHNHYQLDRAPEITITVRTDFPVQLSATQLHEESRIRRNMLRRIASTLF